MCGPRRKQIGAINLRRRSERSLSRPFPPGFIPRLRPFFLIFLALMPPRLSARQGEPISARARARAPSPATRYDVVTPERRE